MATIRLPKVHRSAHTAQPTADTDTSADAGNHDSGPATAGVSYVWFCTIVGAALSVGIGIGVGLDHAGVTEGATSWLAGVATFLTVLTLLTPAWLVIRT